MAAVRREGKTPLNRSAGAVRPGPPSAQTALRHANTTREIRAQWIAPAHIAHGSALEYSEYPGRTIRPFRGRVMRMSRVTEPLVDATFDQERRGGRREWLVERGTGVPDGSTAARALSGSATGTSLRRALRASVLHADCRVHDEI